MKINFRAINHYMKTWRRRSNKTSFSFARYRHLPDIIVCLSYSQIYDDFLSVDPKSFLQNIPTFDLLSVILSYENEIHYCLHDPDFDNRIIGKLYSVLDNNEREKLDNSIRKHKRKSLTFINAEGTLRFVRLALSCFTPERRDFRLNACHLKNIFKAYLYCNQLWTDEYVKINRITYPSLRQSSKSALIDISLKLEIPYSEFKFFKDFRTQLYKAIKLFEFAENNDFFDPLLRAFYKDRNVANWKDYVRIHFYFFETSLKSPVINMQGVHESVIKFMQPYLVDKSLLPIDDNLKGQVPSLLRTQFLLQSTNNPNLILVLSSDLLVDKIYQGLKFDFANIAQVNGIMDGKGRIINQKRINSELGSNFSEEKMLYSVMDMIYDTMTDIVRKPGAVTKNFFEKDGKSEPDYYFREKENLLFIENKDVLFPDSEKYSGQLLRLKTSITNKIAKYRKETNDKKKLEQKKEGLGQIYYNIVRFKDKPYLYRQFDSGCDNVKKIYPVLITYDKAYSAIGVNEYVNKKVSKIKSQALRFYKENYNRIVDISEYDIQKPVIIDIDTLIMYSLLLKEQHLDLLDLIDEYCNKCDPDEPNLASFYTFMMEDHKLGAQGEKFIKLLYGDVLEEEKE